MTTWENELFDCFNVKDVGALCFFNHCCCGLCIWTDSLVKAKVPNARMFGVNKLFGNLLYTTGSSTNSAVLQGIGSAQSTASGLSGRNALAKIYGIEESTFNSIVARCCCPLCGRVQEVNTVMVREGYNYGCAELVSDPKFAVKSKSRDKNTRNGNRPIVPNSINRT